jgi:hypothetical protein
MSSDFYNIHRSFNGAFGRCAHKHFCNGHKSYDRRYVFYQCCPSFFGNPKTLESYFFQTSQVRIVTRTHAEDAHDSVVLFSAEEQELSGGILAC